MQHKAGAVCNHHKSPSFHVRWRLKIKTKLCFVMGVKSRFLLLAFSNVFITNESRSPQHLVNIIKRKTPYKRNFPKTRQFPFTATSYNSCGRAASAFVPCTRQLAFGRAGWNNVFRTSSPFLFNIEPNKKPQSEFSRQVNLEDIGCVSITATQSSGAGERRAERESDWFRGEDPGPV